MDLFSVDDWCINQRTPLHIWLEKIEAHAWLEVPHLTAGESFQPTAVVYVKKTDLNQIPDKPEYIRNLKQWLDDRMTTYIITNSHEVWVFQNMADAVQFKLTWG